MRGIRVTEIEVRLLDGPGDGTTVSEEVVMPRGEDPEMRPIFGLEREGTTYVYHLVRIEHQNDGPEIVYYRYVG